MQRTAGKSIRNRENIHENFSDLCFTGGVFEILPYCSELIALCLLF